MMDFHAHLLPGVDDGSDSIATSLLMLREWQRQGVDRICATPHFYADVNTPGRFLKNRQQAYDELTAAMREAGCTIILYQGAEVRYFGGISGAEAVDDLCLAGTRLLLLEMPFVRWSDRMIDEVAELSRRGITPVAAHIERYLPIQSRKTMRRFMELDILIQANASFFLERRTQKKALRLLTEGAIHFLGSDAHNMTSRKPNLGEAVAWIESKAGTAPLKRLQRIEAAVLGLRE